MTRHSALITIFVALVLGGISIWQGATATWPNYHTGYEPIQPIAYSHRLHAGQLQIPCEYCHFAADESRHAGIPPVGEIGRDGHSPTGVCMSCHTTITAVAGSNTPSPEIAKLRQAVESGQPIRWLKVHNLPDFVRFDHSRHVNGGVSCQACHGPVETMERVRQVPDLSMGWCVSCHRDPAKFGVTQIPSRPGAAITLPSTDCSACHH